MWRKGVASSRRQIPGRVSATLMLPASCSRRLVAELQDALDACADRQRQLEQSLRVSRRLLRAWEPAGSPAPGDQTDQATPGDQTDQATPGCQTDQDNQPLADTLSPPELQELEFLARALEKAVRVRRGTSAPTAGRDKAPRQKVGCTPAPSRAGRGAAAGCRPPRGSRQLPAPTWTPEHRPPPAGAGDKASSGIGPCMAPPKASSAPQPFMLKEKGTLLRLPVAFRRAASINSRLWTELNSQTSGPNAAAAARAQFLQNMQPTPRASSPPSAAVVAAEMRRLRKACSVLRLRLGQELVAGQHPAGEQGRGAGTGLTGTPCPEKLQQEYRSLLVLEGLQAMANQCLQRLQELRTAWSEVEVTAAGGSPSCGGKAQSHWGPQLLVYTSAKELQALVTRKLRVEMLNQQLRLQKILMAELLPLLRAQEPQGTQGLVLYRAAHSLLCEGGEHFISILRDDSPD